MTTSELLTPGDTLAEMMWNACAQRADRVLMRQKEFGIWRETTGRELGETARDLGLGLVSLGFEPGDAAAILANTRREWTEADFAILGAGGVCAGIYPTDAPTQVEYVLADSGSRIVFVEDEEQLDKVLEVRARLPRLARIVVIDMKGLTRFSDPMVISLEDLRLMGEAYRRDHPEAWQARIASRRAEDLAVLVYTSGTTGKPKGAMLSHRNILYTVQNLVRLIPQGEADTRMCFLPLCHVAERVIGQFCALYCGMVLNYVENPETVPENVREIQPTVFLAVPRIWEKFYSAINLRMKDATRLERWAYARAIALGERVVDGRLAGKPVPTTLGFAYAIARRLVLSNVRKAIGVDRCRVMFTGAAPISPQLLRWYMALGLNMLEGYGQTESSGIITFNPPGAPRLGTVGPSVPWGEARISEQGEVLTRGSHVFMGYLNQPEKTAETVVDGWLHSGDVGVMDEAGYIRITDRMKDIIITAGGKNITPSEIENELKFSPYITDAVVIGDRRPYLTCLIMIDHENVEKYAQEHDVPFTDYRSLCRAREVQDLIQGEIDRVNAHFARVEQIKQFRLIEVKLGAEDEELTPTMKLKRKLVNEKYRELIDTMYGS